MMNNTKTPVHPQPNLLFGNGLLGRKVKMSAKVYIDSREQEKRQKVIQYWKDNKEKFPHITSIDVRANAAGDLCTADGFFGNERKSKADFIPSILGGKLKQQLYELKQNFEVAMLFVEDYDGIMDCIEKTPQVHPNAIIGATVSVLAHSRVPIVYVGGLYSKIVLTIIEKLYDGKEEQYQKDYTPVRRAVSKDDDRLNIMLGIPGVKRVRALGLLRKFNNSISAISNASVEELKEVDGIGDTLAKQIKEVLE